MWRNPWTKLAGDSLLYLAVAVAGWLLALWAFKRRDLSA